MKNEGPRKKKLEIKLHDEEEKVIRETFGRFAASVARNYLLGRRVSMPSLSRNQVFLILRAIAVHRLSVLKLRSLADPDHAASAQLLRKEEELFNTTINICWSIFSNAKKAE
jgi:hypothetical protein